VWWGQRIPLRARNGHSLHNCHQGEPSLVVHGLTSSTLVSLRYIRAAPQIAYEMTSRGLDGTEKPFEKPLTTTLLMFVAMALALPIQWLFVLHPEDRNKHHSWKVGISSTRPGPALMASRP
jgi:hypothetical protein